MIVVVVGEEAILILCWLLFFVVWIFAVGRLSSSTARGDGGIRKTVQIYVTSMFRRADDLDARTEALVKAEAQLRLEECLPRMALVISSAAVCLGCVILFQVWRDKERMLDLKQDMLAVAAAQWGVVPLVFPLKYFKGRLWVWYLFIWVMISIFLGLSTSVVPLFITVSLRMVLIVVYPRLSVSVAGTMMSFIASFYSAMAGDLREVCDSAQSRELIIGLLPNLGLSLLFCLHAQQHFLAEVTSSVNARSSDADKSSMKRLLGLVCEVVVQLDDDLCIVGHESKFSAMLMPGSNRTTQGISFLTFMPEDDQLRFQNQLKYLSSESSEHEPSEGTVGASTSDPRVKELYNTGALHTHLQDSMGNRINVELFFVQSGSNPLENQQVFVGLREYESCERVAELRKKKVSTAEDPSSTSSIMEAGPQSFAAPRPPQGKTLYPYQEDDASSSSSFDESNTDDTSGDLQYHLFGETTRRAQVESLLVSLRRWNLKKRRTTCCVFHQAVKHASQPMSYLKRQPCRTFGGVGMAPFCKRCNMFGNGDEDECDVCQSELVWPKKTDAIPAKDDATKDRVQAL